MVALARMVNQTELETSSRQAVECEICKKNIQSSDVKFTTSEIDQPATPIVAEISQQNSQQSSPKEPKEQAVATTEINQQNSQQSSPKEQAVATTEISQQNSQQSSPKEPATSSSSEQAVQQTKEIEPQEQMLHELAELVVDLPIGTNLGMFHFLWMMVTGQLLASRGAIFPALQAAGLSKEAVRLLSVLLQLLLGE